MNSTTGAMMIDRSGKRGAIFGKSGSGKTYFAKNHIVKGMDRVIAFDPEEEFADMRGFVAVSSLQQLADLALDCWEGNFRIAYLPSPGREEQELSEVSRLIERYQEPYRAGKSNDKVTLVVDELNLSFPLNPKPQNDGFARLCSRGRKRGVNLIGISQRPAEVSTRFRGNLDRMSVFELSLKNDWQAVAQYVGEDAQERLVKAGRFHHLAWDHNGVKLVAPT
jgi:hypothetical protein